MFTFRSGEAALCREPQDMCFANQVVISLLFWSNTPLSRNILFCVVVSENGAAPGDARQNTVPAAVSRGIEIFQNDTRTNMRKRK